MLLTPTLLLLLGSLNAAKGANILALATTPSHSHHIWNRALLLALADRGHHVTVLTPDLEKQPVPNYTELYISGGYDHPDNDAWNFESMSQDSALTSLLTFFTWGTTLCEEGLNTKGVQDLMQLKNVTFDLIIVEVVCGECYLGFLPYFNYPPVLGITAFSSPLWASTIVGNPESPAFIPNLLLPYTSEMNFYERFVNSFMYATTLLMRSYYYLPQMDAIVRKRFGDGLPSTSELERNISMILTNTHFSLDFPRPLSPAIVPVGGMHLKPPKPLPPDIKKFMDEATHGVIFFSLGTNVHSNKLGEEKINVLLEAFKQLPQRILWKWESDELPGKPSNVMVGKWLPQTDIFAHPNIKLFITHGGLLSFQEAVYRGVPVVGIPFIADQHINMKKAMNLGIGEIIEYISLSTSSVLTTINKVLGNRSYKDNMKKISETFRDQPQSPLDRAIYWTEYVIRHKGAPQLHSIAADMSWVQYFLLDVLAVLAVEIIVLVVAMWLIMRTFLRMIFGRGQKKTVGQNGKEHGKQH